jgi:hypothetical protein
MEVLSFQSDSFQYGEHQCKAYTSIHINVNDDQQDATILAYLFILNPLYMFRAMSLPIIRSTFYIYSI